MAYKHMTIIGVSKDSDLYTPLTVFKHLEKHDSYCLRCYLLFKNMCLKCENLWWKYGGYLQMYLPFILYCRRSLLFTEHVTACQEL